VPGVAVVSGNAQNAVAPLTLAARSPGSWSDRVALSSSLTVQRFGVLAWYPHTLAIDLIGSSAAALEPGDLLRLTWRDEGAQLFLTVASVDTVDAGFRGRRRTSLRVQGGEARWFDIRRSPADVHGHVQLGNTSVPAHLQAESSSPPGEDTGDEVTLDLDIAAKDAPSAGQVLVATLGSETLLVTVRDTQIVADSGSPGDVVVRVIGTGLWVRQSPFDSAMVGSPHDPAISLAPSVERLRLDLWTRVGSESPRPISELGLALGHRRHVCTLPDDQTVYGEGEWADAVSWSDVVSPRMPVAGNGRPALCIPFGVTATPDHYLRTTPSGEPPLVRDGLVPFNVTLFADEAFLDTRSTTLLDDTELVRMRALESTPPGTIPPPPPPVRGLHAAVPIEEATLIAVPDAVHRGWEKGAAVIPDITILELDHECVDDGRFEDCRTPECGPVLRADSGPDGEVVLSWTLVDHPGPFEVERATSAEWADATTIFFGHGHETTIAEATAGQYYYRVRGAAPRLTEWSNGISSRVTAVGGWRMTAPRRYQDDVLVAVHRLLMRLCAARRDLLAVLSFPEHFDEDDAAAHVRIIAPPTRLVRGELPDDGNVVPPLTGEADALSFAAAYYGWSYVRDVDGLLRTLAPDGPACGVIARRALERGAWIAPANEQLRGLVGLERPTPRERWQELQQLQINLVRQGPQGCVVMSADTLALDDDVRPIGVRRLLILLRRLAARLGPTYVFEPNNAAFRRMVQRGFEERLGELFQRGAFAGATAATAFQVVADERLNTPRSVAQGRFIVELRVAPSRPMVFVTIRLVQTGDRVSVTGG
jgi:hypothetical protein